MNERVLRNKNAAFHVQETVSFLNGMNGAAAIPG